MLLPTEPSKLLAKWQGPYTVTRKVGPVTYEILCPDKQKPKQLLHVNLLKEYHERSNRKTEGEHVLMVQDVQPEDAVEAEVAEMVPFREKCKPQTTTEHLNEEQWHQLGGLFLSYSLRGQAVLM